MSIRIVTPILILTAMAVTTSVGFGQEVAPAIGPDEGVPVVGWQDADQVVGRRATVAGKIVDVGHTDRIHFLNFSDDRAAFKLVIFSENSANFPQSLEEAYLGKLVSVTGIVTLYAGNPQIVLRQADQIKIVDSLPASFVPEFPSIEVGDVLTIGTYNLLNLFDGVDDPYFNDESTPAKPREEMVRVAAVLREINADIVAFQEVESRGYLQRFLDVFVPELGYRHIVHYEGNDLRGINVCLVSRVPIGRVVSHRHLRFPDATGKWRAFNRDLLRVEVLPRRGDPFEIWVVHLKSNSGGRADAEPIRLAEANQVRKLVESRLRQNPNADFLICGDFNDLVDSPTVTTIMGQGAGSMSLKTLFESIPPEQRITYNRDPYQEMIDFILVSPGMASRYIPDSYQIRRGTLEESGSDHNPVVCQFLAHKAVRQASHGARP